VIFVKREVKKMLLKYNFEGYDYEYEADFDYDIIVDFFAEDFGIDRNKAKTIIKEFSLWEELEEYYKEQIKEYYEEEAMDQFEEDREYDKDPEGFYGVSRRYD
jgi:hypothetical protein